MPASAAPLWPRPLVSGDSLSLPHLIPFVKSFFKLFFKVLFAPCRVPSVAQGFLLPCRTALAYISKSFPPCQPFFRFFRGFFFFLSDPYIFRLLPSKTTKYRAFPVCFPCAIPAAPPFTRDTRQISSCGPPLCCVTLCIGIPF